MVKEMFSQSVFSGRIDFSFVDFFMDGNRHGKQNWNKFPFVTNLVCGQVFYLCIYLGILNTEGPHWEELHHFTVRQLRDFGFGKNTMQESIMAEVNEFIDLMAATKGEPVTNVKDPLGVAVVNSLWFMATGTRHQQNDPELVGLAKKVHSYAPIPIFLKFKETALNVFLNSWNVFR